MWASLGKGTRHIQLASLSLLFSLLDLPVIRFTYLFLIASVGDKRFKLNEPVNRSTLEVQYFGWVLICLWLLRKMLKIYVLGLAL